jgi:hypothetical protein
MLVNSGNDCGIDTNANAQAWPPLNIISLGTALENAFGDLIELTLLDGQIDSVETIVKEIYRLQPNVVAVSMYLTSINNTLRIVQAAKNIGAITILGNDHAAFHYQTLLTKVKEIDFICLNDVGEDTIVSLGECILRKSKISKVPLLAYRVNDEIRVNSAGTPRRGGQAFDSIPIPNRNLLASHYWQKYLVAFRKQHHRTFDPTRVQGVATINRARGCSRVRSRCRYCGIADLTIRGSSPSIFWKDVRRAREQVGATYLYEVFDSATSWPSLLKQWADARPNDLADTCFFMYANASQTNEHTVDVFSRLGVYCVNIGFDSGDTQALQLLRGKLDSLETNRRAARLWTEAGIEMYVSFVLMGMGNEKATRTSLDKTLEFAEWLASSTTTVSLDCALLYPDKSSMIGAWIWNPSLAKSQTKELGWNRIINMDLLKKMSEKWKNEVFLDPLALSADFAKVCGVDSKVLLGYDREIQKISARCNMNFGRSQAGPVD